MSEGFTPTDYDNLTAEERAAFWEKVAEASREMFQPFFAARAVFCPWLHPKSESDDD